MPHPTHQYTSIPPTYPPTNANAHPRPRTHARSFAAAAMLLGSDAEEDNSNDDDDEEGDEDDVPRRRDVIIEEITVSGCRH